MEILKIRENIRRVARKAPLVATFGLSLALAACSGGRSASEQVAFDFTDAVANGNIPYAMSLSGSTTGHSRDGQISSLSTLLRGCKVTDVKDQRLTIFDTGLDANVLVTFAEPCGLADPLSGRGYSSARVGLFRFNGEMHADPFQTIALRTPRT